MLKETRSPGLETKDFTPHSIASSMGSCSYQFSLSPPDLTGIMEHTGTHCTCRKPQPFIRCCTKTSPNIALMGGYSEHQINLPFLWRETLSIFQVYLQTLKSQCGTKALIDLVYKTCGNMTDPGKILPAINFPFLIGYFTWYNHSDLTIPSHSQCDLFVFASPPKINMKISHHPLTRFPEYCRRVST